MSLHSAPDVPLLINSPNSRSERRINPSWTISAFKTRLEPITGIPTSCQQLSLRVGSQDAVAITAADEEQTQLGAFALQPYAEITVSGSSFFFFFFFFFFSLLPSNRARSLVVSPVATSCYSGCTQDTPGRQSRRVLLEC
jgi:hypothetical protein